MLFAKVSKVSVNIENEENLNVTWGANSVHIPNYIRDGYVSYEQYSLAPPESRFWVSKWVSGPEIWYLFAVVCASRYFSSSRTLLN